MRRASAIAAVAAALALVPAAQAAAPVLTVAEAGLSVTLTADSIVHWDFGDGQAGDGASLVHAYAKPGSYIVTATAGDGETAQLAVAARAVLLTRPPVTGYGQRLTFRGVVVPAQAGKVTLYRAGSVLGSARSQANGRFQITARVLYPGGYTVAAGTLRSAAVPVVVRPILRTTLLGSTAVGGRLQLRAQLHPAGGRLAIAIFRDGKRIGTRRFGATAVLAVDTRRTGTLHMHVISKAAPGYAPVSTQVSALVVEPHLAVGATGRSVAALTNALAALHYVTPRTAAFDDRVLDGLYAFQKVQGLPRTGVADAATWAALGHPRIAKPRYEQPANHLEIDKTHQVLYVVRGSRVAQIVPVSTAGLPGRFTPVGRFSIYRKVTGFDPSPLGTLYDPMYFTGGYALHGNPSVPPYPASHGCVRVPMWIAPLLYATNDYGEIVDVY